MRRSVFVTLSAVLGLVLGPMAPLPGAADIRLITFAGTLDLLEDEESISDGSVSAGTLFSGSIYLDTSAASPFSTPPWTFEVQVGNYSLFTAPISQSFLVGIENDGPFDSVDVSTMAGGGAVLGATSSPVSSVEMTLFLEDDSATALDSSSLANVPFELSPWSLAEFSFAVYTESEGSFSGSGFLDDLSYVVVPEPSTSALLALGLLGLGARKRRRGSAGRRAGS